MAEIYAEHLKLNEAGIYDTAYEKTKAWLVERDDGSNVEDELARLEAGTVPVEHSDKVAPASFKFSVSDTDGTAVLYIKDLNAARYTFGANFGNPQLALMAGIPQADGKLHIYNFYHTGYKPSAADVGALPLTGGTLTGSPILLGNGTYGEDGSVGINFQDTTTNNQGMIGFLSNSGQLTELFGDDAASIGIGVQVVGSVNPVFFRISGSVDPKKMLQVGTLVGNKYSVYHEGNKPSPAAIGAATPSKTVNFTLAAAGWTGTAAPYTQTVTATGVTASSNGTVGIADNATDAQWLAAAKAQIRKSAQAANSLTVKAYGEKPTVDIPCSVIIVG